MSLASQSFMSRSLRLCFFTSWYLVTIFVVYVCLNVALVLCFGEIETACDLQCSESIIPTEYLLVPTGTYKCRVEPYQRGTVLGNNTDGVNYTDIVQNL